MSFENFENYTFGWRRRGQCTFPTCEGRGQVADIQYYKPYSADLQMPSRGQRGHTSLALRASILPPRTHRADNRKVKRSSRGHPRTPADDRGQEQL